MTIPADERQILQSLYATARPGGGWGAALATLATILRAHSAQITLIDGQTRHDWTHGTPSPIDSLRHLREGRVYTQEDLGPAAPPLRALRMGLTAGAMVWLVLERAPPGFRAADTALLDRLGPHLQTAAETWRQLTAERQGAERHAHIAARLGCGWVTLDTTARLRDADIAARALLARHPALTITPDGRLDTPDPASARALRLAIEAACEGRTTTLDALHLTIVPDTSPGQVLALLRLQPSPATDPLIQSLGLTRAEARLAARLVDGDSLAEAATHLGWSLETARSTSKQIYARLGVSGQPALIRRLLTSPLWLAP